MADHSTIEWTDATWNPLRGCDRVSPGCVNCYAEVLTARFSRPGMWGEGLAKWVTRPDGKREARWTGKIVPLPHMLGLPGRWTKPRRIFVNSMSDLFHKDVPDSFIADVWFRMALNQQHVFQILTKRPERMLEWVINEGADAVFAGERAEYEDSLRRHGWPLRNVWLGVSVEDQARADERIPLLLKTPAAVRWISAEPLLGPISFEGCWVEHRNPAIHENWLERLNWVVVGGESGPGARPMHPDWARSLRDQCAATGTPFFFKQWGAWAPPIPEGDVPAEACEGRLYRVGKKAAGRILDGRTHDAYPA